ncbi:MAG: M20 family metallo-hydrolase [Candidatus Aminicenantia bacterium]
MREFERIAKRIEDFRDEMIQLQKDITAIPALDPSNGGEGETEKAEFLKGYLKKMKFAEIMEFNCPDSRVPSGYRPNIIAIYKGQSSSKRTWIMTHMDVVPPGELNLWKGDPYKAWVEDGKIFGRGVEDNQQAMVASIFALKAFEAEGLLPKYDVGIVLVSDEETGSDKGITYVLKNTEIFRKEDLIIVPDAGNYEGTMIEVAEKSILWLKFHILGKQCHGSMPQKGINSHKAGANLIVRLDEFYKIFDAKDELFEPPISTFEPTKKEANVPNINTIPGDDIFYFDCRVLPNYKLSDIESKFNKYAKEIEEIFKVNITINPVQRAEAAPPTPPDAPVVKSLAEAIKAVYGKEAKPMGIGGGTVAAIFRRAGFYAACWSKMDEMAHQPNEYCIIENMVGDSKVFAHVMLQD